MKGLRRKRTLEALRLLAVDLESLGENLHSNDTISRSVLGGGRAQHFRSPEVIDVHGGSCF